MLSINFFIFVLVSTLFVHLQSCYAPGKVREINKICVLKYLAPLIQVHDIYDL